MEENKNNSNDDFLRQERLQELVDMAFHSGLVSAIEKAKKMHDPYILDAFHDLLVDRLYKELIERGKLEEL